MYNYQKTNEYFAQVPGMMEEICEAELIELGAKNTKVAYRGVSFNADTSVLYKINYTSRLTSRVLAPLTSFYCKDTKVLRNEAFKIKWDTFFKIDKTFSITASVSNSKIRNSLAASQYMKDGIVDYFRSISNGKRPDVNVENPDIRFNLHIEEDEATISIDTSGQSLHKRGYRLSAGEAPMQETLAAALIRLSNYEGEILLNDVTFKVERGDKIALVGPNDLLKTTLFNILANQDKADGGNFIWGLQLKRHIPQKIMLNSLMLI